MSTNNVKHLQLNDDSIVLQMSTGPIFLTPQSFNYNKIRRLLPTTEEVLLPLLEVPPLPNGIYYLYAADTLYLRQVKDSSVNYGMLVRNKFVDLRGAERAVFALPIVGMYADITEIRNDFPEYFI